MRSVPIAALAILAACGSARADLVVTMKRTVMRAEPPTVEKQQVLMSAQKLTTTGQGPQGAEYKVIFRGDKGLMWNLDPATKTYMEIDKASMAAMSAQADAAMKMMQERMAELPPEQRAQMEKMMPGGMPGAPGGAAPALEVKATGEKQQVHGYACTRYDVLVGGKKTTEMWVTGWGDAHVKKEDVEAMRGMASFFEDLVKSNRMLRDMAGSNAYRGLDRIDGFPVLVRHFDGDKVVEEQALESVESKSVDASAFELPAGYARKTFGPPSGPGRGPGAAPGRPE